MPNKYRLPQFATSCSGPAGLMTADASGCFTPANASEEVFLQDAGAIVDTGENGPPVATVSRNAVLSDNGNLLKCDSGSAIVITILADGTTRWFANETLAIYQAGVGAASFAAGAGVTFRGTVPTPAQYAITGIMRVGVNEWAFVKASV